MLLFVMCQSQEFTETMPFIKADTINSEKVMYTSECLQNIVRTFDNRPVYFVQYNPKGQETGLVKVGNVTCCFMKDKGWIDGRLESTKPIPKDYVLRAHVRATKSKTLPDGTYLVDEVEIVKFYLKPKDKAVTYLP